MNKIDIKERLEHIFKHLNISQKEFSRKTGISENTLSHAKKGKHTPTIEFFNSIYKLLPHLNAEWLYMGMGEMFSETKNTIQDKGKQLIVKISKTRIRLSEDECNDELENAEKEISYLKNRIDDKEHIIELLKNSDPA